MTGLAPRVGGQQPCAVPGCDGTQLARGWCNLHYARWRRHGDPTVVVRIQGDDHARLFASIERAPDGCWLWMRTLRRDGYGKTAVIRDGVKRTIFAHRFAYELLVGPIPDGMELDHVCHSRDLTCRGGQTCRHRRCVNPNHLEPVTQLVNTRRGRNAGRTHCPAGHEYDEDNTRWYRGKRHCRTCDRLRLRERRSRRAV